MQAMRPTCSYLSFHNYAFKMTILGHLKHIHFFFYGLHNHIPGHYTMITNGSLKKEQKINTVNSKNKISYHSWK